MASVHRETLTQLVKGRRWTRGAELGVDKGILFGMLLRECPRLYLIGVDTFPNLERSHRAFELLKQYQRRAELYMETTKDASRHVYDSTLDFVFIDADHSYLGVKQDISHWRSKVKPGGWLGGHDYNPKRFPQVVRAVDETFGSRVELRPGDIWGVWV